MAHLAMFVSRLPGLRVTELTREHAEAVVDLVRDMELTYFETSQTNPAEILGTLHAPELHGTRGTVGLWDDGRLTAALLAYDALDHERGLFLDLFVRQGPQRRQIAERLLAAARAYAGTLSARPGAWLKVETFAGDTELAEAVTADAFVQHRVYLRMRVDFDATPEPPVLPAGLGVRAMTDDEWPAVHTAVTESFRDHYDFHPLPLSAFQRSFDRETTDFTMWRLVVEGDDLVGVGIGSRRYAPYDLGYVETLAVRRQARGRGIGTYLLLDRFSQDCAEGFLGTSLHCDAQNLTGATRLYESVGMRRDHHYDAWRARL